MPSLQAIRLRLSQGRSSSLTADKPWERNMAFQKTFIPYGGYWSSPFARWQGSFANLHALKLAGDVTRKALEARDHSPKIFSNVYLGMTIPALQSFYGAPWLAGMIGAEGVTGPVFSSACPTSARGIGSAAQTGETGSSSRVLAGWRDPRAGDRQRGANCGNRKQRLHPVYHRGSNFQWAAPALPESTRPRRARRCGRLGVGQLQPRSVCGQQHDPDSRECRERSGHRHTRSEEHTSELQSRLHHVCRL